MSIYLIIIILYFAIIILVSALTKRVASRSAADYLVAGRNLGFIACAVVIAAEWLGGMSTIGVSEKAFLSGTMQPILYNLSTAAGMIIIGFTVAKHYRKNSVHTVSEMIGNLFGVSAKNVSSFAFLFAYVVLAFVQLQTCSSVIATLFAPELNKFSSLLWIPGNEWFWAVLLSAAVITVYTYIGGMHALAITGMIHVVVMFTGLGLAMVTGLREVNGLSSLHQRMVELGSPEDLWNPFSGGLSYAWMLIIGGVLGGMAGQASIQPVFAAKSVSVAKKAALFSALIIAPFGLMVAILGLIARTGQFFDTSTVNPKMVLPILMTTPEFIHPVAGGIALAGILAAILSTVGPVNFAVITIATKDIYNGLINRTASDQKIISTARRLVVLVNLITIPLALLGGGAILDTAYISYGIRAIGAIVIIMGIYSRGLISVKGVIWGFTGGTLAVIINILITFYARNMELLGKDQTFLDNTYLAIGSALFFIIVGNMHSNRLRRKLSVNQTRFNA